MSLPSANCTPHKDKRTPLVVLVGTLRLNFVVWAEARRTPCDDHRSDVARLREILLNPLLRGTTEPTSPESPSVAVDDIVCSERAILATSPRARGLQVPLCEWGDAF